MPAQARARLAGSARSPWISSGPGASSRVSTRSATPATDNFSYPTMTGSDPARNPQRQRFWTPVYFDSEVKAWMVSVIQPLDWQGRWVGTVGHDITIDALLQQIVDAEAPMGSTAMILSGDGQLIAHPQLRAVTLSFKRLGQAPGDATADQLDRAAELADRRVEQAGDLGQGAFTKQQG